MPAARVVKPRRAAPSKPSNHATRGSADSPAPANRRAATIGTRLRKNIKNLTEEEWSRFVQALKAIKGRSRPGGVIPIYDEFCALHMGAIEMHKAWQRDHSETFHDAGNADPGHDNPSFLPWHRQVLLEFEAALQSIDPAVTLPYWDWTDRDFNKVLFSDKYVGGNGGANGKGGAVADGPFTVCQGWEANKALHRPTWFKSTRENETFYVQQPSLGRSIVRYMGDSEDLATEADVTEFCRRKPTFGPRALVRRDDLLPRRPATEISNDASLPRGSLWVGKGLPEWLPEVPLQFNNNRSFRENIQGFRWALEASPHMHNQTHDWFGYHTNMLQDDDVSNASTMANAACATVDPIFFLHHCNIDRLWAEWQDSGHYGSIFFPKRSDTMKVYKDADALSKSEEEDTYTYPQGHNLDDDMWPWDSNQMWTHRELQFMIPQFPYQVSPRNVLDYRALGYRYETSTQISVNTITPVVVYLPASADAVTHQVFPVDIQRPCQYLVAARNTGRDTARLTIEVWDQYQEMPEHEFISKGFKSGEARPVEPDDPEFNDDESDDDDDESDGNNEDFRRSMQLCYTLDRGTYYIVIRAENTVPSDMPRTTVVDCMYEVGIATDPTSFRCPEVPVAPGTIKHPQVPADSWVYLPRKFIDFVELEDGITHLRRTRIKGSRELFNLYVHEGPGRVVVDFRGMDALVQLYGPFNLNSHTPPRFNENGTIMPNDNLAWLNSRLQIASSEGCCKRLGSGIQSLVPPGRYVLVIFHCSIGANEGQNYTVTHHFRKNELIPPLSLGIPRADPEKPNRVINQLYLVKDEDGTELVTREGDFYKLSVYTDDATTREQVRVAVFTYQVERVGRNSRAVLKNPTDEHNVNYRDAYWGHHDLTFEPSGDQFLFVRVTILNGVTKTRVKTILDRVAAGQSNPGGPPFRV